MAKTVGVDKLARVLGITPRTVQRFVQEGMPRDGHGKYDLAKCLVWVARRKVKDGELEGDTPDSLAKSLRSQRERLIRAQADREELELARARASLVPVEAVREFITQHNRTVRQRILTLPSRIAHQLEGESRDVIEAKLDQALRGALAALADELRNGNGNGHKPESPAGNPQPAPSGNVGTPASAEDQRVGRAEPHPAERGKRKTRTVGN